MCMQCPFAGQNDAGKMVCQAVTEEQKREGCSSMEDTGQSCQGHHQAE